MTAEPDTPAPLPHSASAPTTGDTRVDAATAGLTELDALPVSEHVERYAGVHAQLQGILNEIGSPTSPPE